MGALKNKLPITYITMLLGTLAISGIPFFSGFFSKDEILWKAYSSPLGNPWLWGVGFLTAGLTAFYDRFKGEKETAACLENGGNYPHNFAQYFQPPTDA